MTSYGSPASRAYPELNAWTLPAKWRTLRSGSRTSSIHWWSRAYLCTISSVPSVDPSLTITHFNGRTVCETTDFSVSSMYWASFRAGVTRT